MSKENQNPEKPKRPKPRLVNERKQQNIKKKKSSKKNKSGD